MLGFVRVAITAYLLGTHSRADSLAVAMGPLDSLNGLLTNSVLFAFVPMLAACAAGERMALFRKLSGCFAWAFAALAAVIIAAAPLLMKALAPGLAAPYFATAVLLFRIMALSVVAAGVAAVHCALLYTDRRFLPTAFYQAALNVCTITAALSLWKFLGVYAFACGYAAGAWVQLAIVYFASRSDRAAAPAAECKVHWREILSRPWFFVVYAAALGMNMIFLRAWATHVGPGMAAALDYCLRGITVPMALLVTPIANSLLPEIARLRSLSRMRDALRLIDRTIALAALIAVAGCAIALTFRTPAIALLFQRGSFTAESTRLVAAVFLGLGPSLVGWSLLEITARSLFALDRPWPAVIAASIPPLFNVILTVRLHSAHPAMIGLGASLGLLTGFAAIFAMAHARRARWMVKGC